MRKLNDARRQWEERHCSNSPFRIDNYGSSSSIGFDSASCGDNSPMPQSRGYGIRSMAAKGDQYLATQPPLNLSNKQSSFAKNKSSGGKTSSLINATNSPISGAQGSTLMSQGSNESLSPRPCSIDDEIHEGFADEPQADDPTFMEGPCYLKTKTDRFKEHWAVLNGNEIFCYRNA